MTALQISLETLHEAGTADRAGPRVGARLADVVAFFRDDMEWIERELLRASGDGVAPATHAADHLLSSGGKRVRPLALLLSAACFTDGGRVPPSARELAVACEIVHAATLLHDDVIDDADERRGRRAARRVFGNAVSVLAGDLLLTHALERTQAAAAPPHVLRELITTLRTLVDGEVVQLRGRTRLDLGEATYFRIVQDKTASLFVWATRAGAAVGGASAAQVDALGEYGARLGVAFQLVDDVLDYSGDAAATGKGLLADLHEGKLTLPLLRAIARAPELMADVEAARAGDATAADRIHAAVRAGTACQEVRVLARQESDAALAALAGVPACPPREMLAQVARELAGRLG